jgi:hypothetical protein
MSHQRAHVVIPTELVKEIDDVVGQRKRSQFLVAAAERELQRLKQLAAIESCAGGWGRQRHPELAGGSTRFVKKLRKESDRRLR